MATAMKTGRVSFQGMSIKRVTNYYQLHTVGTVAPTGEWSTAILLVTAEYRFLWCYTETEYTNGNITRTDPYVLSAYGERGITGPSYYPAGSWESDTLYKWDGKTCPVVEYGNNYYALGETEVTKTEGAIGINPATEVANKTGNWVLFDMMKYVMTEVLFTDFAKLGWAVFYGKYMSSQKGVDSLGGDTYSYQLLNYEDPMNSGNAFQPNILLDFFEGKAWFNDVTVKGDLYGRTISFDELDEDSSGIRLPQINGRYGMFYMDTLIGMSRSVQRKTFIASGSDMISRITGASSVSTSSTLSITNQETVIFFSTPGDKGDMWSATVIPYWISSTEPTNEMMVDMILNTESDKPIANSAVAKEFNRKIQLIKTDDEAEDPDVLYIITG